MGFFVTNCWGGMGGKFIDLLSCTDVSFPHRSTFHVKKESTVWRAFRDLGACPQKKFL